MPVDVELDESGKHVIINTEWRLKELCKSIPGAKWDARTQVWNVPTSWATCLALRSTFKTDLQIGPRLTAWASNEVTTRITPANTLRDLETLEEGNEDLFPHQRAGVKFLSVARRALLADEPGLGKTAQAIRALKQLQDNGEDVFPALIVCPNTLKKNWKREFDMWWPGVDVEVIKGSATQRRKIFENEADVYVINWESLRSHSKLSSYGSIALARCQECGGHDEKVTVNRCEVHKRELNLIDFKAVVADEIHRSKEPKSKQSRALWAATGDADIRFALTGTPIANNVLDLWSILHWLSPEEWPSKTRWVDRMVNVMLNAFGGMMVLGVKPHMEQEFYATVNPRMRRMLKARVLPSCKVDSLMDDISNGDFGDDSVAVCAVSRQLIDLLSAEMTKAKIPHGLITGAQDEDERQQAVDDFQSGKIKWILFTAQAGGVGITLTAARRLVMLQRPWSLVDHKQALDRVHRIGSEIHDSIIVTDYVTDGSIEERVIQVLSTKADNFEQIVKDKDKLLSLLKDDKAGKL